MGPALSKARSLGPVLLLMLVALSSRPVVAQPAAQPAAAPATDPREVSARKLFGVGKYAEALEIYGNLYADTAHPTYLRNIGRCYQNLGMADKAISSFREYLRQAKNLPPDQRAMIEGYIREMEDLQRRAPPQVAGGAAAKTDHSPTSPIATSPATSLATSPDAPAAETPGDDHGPHRSRTAAFVVGGVSLAALGAGAVFGVLALSNKHTADPGCPMDLCNDRGFSANESARNDARIADVALGLGVIGAAVTAYLVLSAPLAKAAERSAETSARLHLLPALGPGLAGALAETTW